MSFFIYTDNDIYWSHLVVHISQIGWDLIKLEQYQKLLSGSLSMTLIGPTHYSTQLELKLNPIVEWNGTVAQGLSH